LNSKLFRCKFNKVGFDKGLINESLEWLATVTSLTDFKEDKTRISTKQENFQLFLYRIRSLRRRQINNVPDETKETIQMNRPDNHNHESDAARCEIVHKPKNSFNKDSMRLETTKKEGEFYKLLLNELQQAKDMKVVNFNYKTPITPSIGKHFLTDLCIRFNVFINKVNYVNNVIKHNTTSSEAL
jgi:hypothetical protein